MYARLHSSPASTPFTNPIFDRPFALLMGPQRTGTSWIDRYLRARGDVALPNGVKETFFFDRRYSRGIEFYKSHFTPAPRQKLVMEVSTTSFDHPDAPKRVFENFGQNIRLLCPLRHPVTRSYSLYLHYKRYGMVTGTLQEACIQNPQILTSSHYAIHIEKWIAQFGLNKIHFLFQEQMDMDLNYYVATLCDALHIPCILPATETRTRFNSRAAAPLPGLARAAHDSAQILRRYKLYPLINAAKKIGLKNFVFGMENQIENTSIPADARDWLENQLSGQAGALEEIIGPVSCWR
jgi:hypothetical protein